MGDGRTDSVKWQPDRKVSTKETATYWQNQFLQLKSERDYQAKINVRLAQRVVNLEKELNEYRQAFGPIGFNIPGDDE